ncbi:hypothetical protein PPYR_12642 [Photinus pyralis]|uniref:RNA-directed DNA polymerase n=2 Tax=Photinus pyralis TaxID=7054 RepID=A0A5N4A6S5_PHOPY|nr:hypothetical protein PPYR_12642 [Photinus pyralis]
MSNMRSNINLFDIICENKEKEVPVQNFVQIQLNPRQETLVHIKASNNFKNQEAICPEMKILNGVHLCPSIVKVDNENNFITTILNTTDKVINIYSISVFLEPLEKPAEITIYNVTSTGNHNSSRLAIINNLLRTDHLNSEEKDSLFKICKEFNHIFHVDGDKLTYTDSIKHSIPTSSQTPVNTKTYRFPAIHKEEVNKQVNKMLEDNVIEPSYSPWNSPIWVVPKKSDASGTKKWRIVVDYRKLNDITIGDSFPLPNISDILDQLGHSKYYSVIDLKSGFHQIKMDKNDAPKTAFSTPTGHYQFNRMPFGLKTAPATFQRLINNVLIGLNNQKCFVYLDDIVVHGDTLENHNIRLKEVFQRLADHNLKIEPDKCEFLRKEVSYLGHIITDEGVKPDPNKVKAVMNYPILKTHKDIKAFLGLAGYYRRFIPKFSELTQPFTRLLKKNVKFIWTSEQQEAFEKLKLILSSEPILQYPDFSKPFCLTTDASNYAIGAVLSQGQIPNDLPIAYASRTLNHAEGNYSTIEKELLAIVWSIKHFRPYLYGQKFKIITDHRPLTWLFNVKDPGSRLIRWRLLLEEYDYEINYKPGELNKNADALSRNPPPVQHTATINPVQTNINDSSYTEFLNKLKSTVICNDNVKEIHSNLINCRDNIALLISKDLEFTEPLQKDITNKFPSHKNQIEKNLEDSRDVTIIKIPEKNQNLYYIITKEYYFNSITYEEMYNYLIQLKNQLLKDNISSISMSKLSSPFEHLHWNKVRTMMRFIFKNTNLKINIYLNDLTTPENPDIIREILTQYHSKPIGGHSGFHRTYSRIKQLFKWIGMKRDIKNFIKNCESCQKNKLVRKKNKEPMVITTTSTASFERIFLDIVGPLPLTENDNRYILTLQDDLTKYSQAYAIPNHEAHTVATKLVHEFICKYGIPETIVTDQGKEFTSNLLKQVAKLFKIKQINCSSYHPESNGALERSHHTLAEYLKHYIQEKQTDWDNWIDFAMFSYNTTVHTTTKFTPFELLFGIKANLPTSITKNPQFKYTYDDYIDNLTLKLQESQAIARKHILGSKEQNKKYYDQNSSTQKFDIGDKVFLLNEQSKPGRAQKLIPNYSGPYEIVEVNPPVNCTLLVKNKRTKVHNNKLKLANSP